MKKIIAVTGGQGQVGKTCVALNLAVALQKSGASVCLLDAVVGEGSSVGLIGARADATFRDFLSDGALLTKVCLKGPLGITIIPGAVGFQNFDEQTKERQEEISGEIKTLDKFDYMIVDTSAELLTENIALLRAADMVLSVYNQTADTIVSALLGIKILCDHDYSNEIMLLPNIFEYDPGSKALAQSVEDRAKEEIDKRIESFPVIYVDPAVTNSVINRRPFVEVDPLCPTSVGIKKISFSILKSKSGVTQSDTTKYISDVAKYAVDVELAGIVYKQKSCENCDDELRNKLLTALGFDAVEPAIAEETPEPAPAEETPEPAIAEETPEPAPAEETPEPAIAEETPEPAIAQSKHSTVHTYMEPVGATPKYIVDIFEKNVVAQEKILELLTKINAGSPGLRQRKGDDSKEASKQTVDDLIMPTNVKTFFLDFDDYLSKRED